MNKYLIVGIIAFFLMVSSVYALSDNNNDNLINESTVYNQNCPYHYDHENCPYYNETTKTHTCLNSENGNCQHHNGGNGKGYGRRSGCLHHNR